MIPMPYTLGNTSHFGYNWNENPVLPLMNKSVYASYNLYSRYYHGSQHIDAHSSLTIWKILTYSTFRMEHFSFHIMNLLEISESFCKLLQSFIANLTADTPFAFRIKIRQFEERQNWTTDYFTELLNWMYPMLWILDSSGKTICSLRDGEKITSFCF